MNGGRLVQCPKCRFILKELAHVPVYRCGSCDTILQSKAFSLERENPSSENLSEVPKETVSSSTDAKDEFQTAESHGPQSFTVTNASDSYDKGLSLENRAIGTVEMDLEMQHSRENVSYDGVVVHDAEEKVHEKQDSSLNAEAKESEQGHDSLNSTHEKRGSGESDLVDEANASDGDASDDSFSSCDGFYRADDQIVTELSLRKVQETVDNKDCEERKRHFRSSDTVNQIEASVPLQRESFNMNTSTVQGENDEKFTDMSTKCRSVAEKDTSLDTVKNFLEPAKDDGSVKFLAVVKTQTDSVSKMCASITKVQKQILTKIDELSDEIKTYHLKETREKESFRPMKLDSHSHSKPYRRRDSVPRQQRCSRVPSALPPIKYSSSHDKMRERPAKLSQGIYRSLGSDRASSHYLNDSSFPSATKLSKASSRPSFHRNDRISDKHRLTPHDRAKREHGKHHCRPICGGAPFVICPNCSELLQVPLDILVADKSLRKLRCSACSQVIVFPSRAVRQSFPHSPSEVRHPPSEADGSIATNDFINEICGSHSRVKLQSDPILYRKDSVPSSDVSRSTNAEQLNVSLRNYSVKAGDMNNERARRAQLHRLMGYDSASEILYKHSDSDEGFDGQRISHFVHPREGSWPYGIKGKSKV